MPRKGAGAGSGRQAGASLVKEAAQVYAALDAGARPARKNHYLNQAKLDLARKILGVKTETDAIDTALDLVIYAETLAQGTEAMAGEEYQDVLGLGSEVPPHGG